MKEIGNGTFTIAYQHPSGKVILKSVDPVKRAMASGKLPTSSLFPAVEYVEQETKRVHVFSMKHYTTLSRLGICTYDSYIAVKRVLTPKHARLYAALTDIADSYGKGIRSIIKGLKQLPEEFATERDEIIAYARALSKETKTPLAFETYSFNVAVENKKLILLDCFYPIDVRSFQY